MVFKRGRRALKTLRTFKTLRSYSKVVGFTGATGAWESEGCGNLKRRQPEQNSQTKPRNPP